MMNTQKLLKVSVVWTSIVYTVCFLGVLVFAPIRPGFMMYALHMRSDTYGFQSVLTLNTFISGLIIWNVIVVLGAWLFVGLWNRIK
jgi:hypothetical protein